MTPMPVAEALSRVLAGAEPLPAERVPLAAARGRVLAEPLVALRTQPGFDGSAMDGYAVRAAEAAAGTRLPVRGESAAGHRHAGPLGPGEAIRIFTGAPLPEGADAVLVQENARREGDTITVETAPRAGAHIRRRGLDFREGEPGLPAGLLLGPRDLALAAAMGHPALPVRRRPRVAILATGDELVLPGQDPGPDGVVASNSFALAALAEQEGAEPIDLGIAPDSLDALEAAIRRARDTAADVLVTIGGASVGDHDLVQSALRREGMDLGFWRIAMRPGRPVMHGRLGPMHILGMPGNPVSAIVCGVLFLLPLLRALQDRTPAVLPRVPARLAVDLPANDAREDYLRATRDDAGAVTPFSVQDSSMLRLLREADCLLVRASHAPASPAGETCEVLDLRAAGL